jgi:hypothetical protein
MPSNELPAIVIFIVMHTVVDVVIDRDISEDNI